MIYTYIINDINGFVKMYSLNQFQKGNRGDKESELLVHIAPALQLPGQYIV